MTTETIPTTLPLLPLADKVLLPSIITKLVVHREEASGFVRRLCIKNPVRQHVVCVPLHRQTLPNTEAGSVSKSSVDPNRADAAEFGERAFRLCPSVPVAAQGASHQPADMGYAASVTTDTAVSQVNISQLYHVGCVAQVLEMDDTFPDTLVLLVKGICRTHVEDILTADGASLEAVLTHYPDPAPPLQEIQDAFCNILQAFVSRMETIGISRAVLRQWSHLVQTCSISDVAHLLMSITETTLDDKITVLTLSDPNEQLQIISQAVVRHLKSIETSKEIQQNVEQVIDQKRREFYLRQQVADLNSMSCDLQVQANAIVQKTGSKQTNVSQGGANGAKVFTPSPDDDDDLLMLVDLLNRACVPNHAQTAVQRDLQRLRKLSPHSPEHALLRTYIECIADLPWSKSTPSKVDVAAAKRQLDMDHFGMEKVKRRIIEYLAVIKVKQDLTPPILCFVGPPGVGKTTLARSIATALNRSFYRISLGGIRDEADVRGHRRTYVGALPGRFIHGLRRCAVNNPVMLLDEIDKVVQGTSAGNPAAALLEVLDPEQNASFTDHFLNLPFDLSNVLFVATANTLESIPAPLLDRMEVVMLSGYTMEEKLHIAKTHLLPKQLRAHGLTLNDFKISDEVIRYVIDQYTRESGVRNLDRAMASLCRYKCHEKVNLQEEGRLDRYVPCLGKSDIPTILGLELFESEVVSDENVPGVIAGLSVSQGGHGSLMWIEASEMPGTGELKLTGSLGQVLKESAHIALSWVKANAYALGLTSSSKDRIFYDTDLHLHLPSGAVPKDGPSAGVTMMSCIISLLSGQVVPRTMAMTGEITLRGQVRPVGGIKEKILAAHRAGVTTVILPAMNRKDVLQDVPKSVTSSLTLVYCKTLWDVISVVFNRYEHTVAGQQAACASRL